MHAVSLAGPLSVTLYVLAALGSSLHALLTKDDPRSALSWIALCVLVPYGGALLYWLLGINRVRRRVPATGLPTRTSEAAAALAGPAFAPQVRIGDALTRRPLEPGNSIEPLNNGEQAFPKMPAWSRRSRLAVAARPGPPPQCRSRPGRTIAGG